MLSDNKGDLNTLSKVRQNEYVYSRIPQTVDDDFDEDGSGLYC